MQDCKDYIVKIYQHPSICSTIAKIKPTDLQDDLKQELALCLLNYDCNKIYQLQENNDLIRFSMKILMSMAIGTSNNFYRTYKKSDIKKAIEYFRLQEPKPSIPISFAAKAKEILTQKEQSKDNNASHEARIFAKYVELKSCDKVAEYYSIPKLHVWEVVKKVKNELKTKLLQ